MQTGVLLALLVLLPTVAAGGAGGGSTAPYELATLQSSTLHLRLDREAEVLVAVHFNMGSVRDLRLDGPGACDAVIDGSTGVGDSTMGWVRCRLPAGTSSWTLSLDLGYVRGYLASSAGTWR